MYQEINASMDLSPDLVPPLTQAQQIFISAIPIGF
jgi:hypothetical protein